MLLRLYQTKLISDIRAAFACGKRRVLAVAPTGAGKTVLAAEMIRQAVAKGRHVLFVVHRVELVDQAVERLAAFDVPAGEIIADRPEDRTHHVQVASVQTLARRIKPHADLLFCDEAHHCAADQWREMLSHYSSAWCVGLSGTPARLDGLPLDMFDTLVLGPTTAELCASGVLLAPEVYSHPMTPDLRKLKIRAGDYEQEKLAEIMSESKLVGAIVPHWLERAGNARTVAYGVNIAHSRLIADSFAAAGIPSAHIDGTTPAKERAAILAQLRDGTLRVVSNCMVLTEGWDLPELEIAILARPTASFVLYRQMVGRIMRTAPGKSGCIVLDHAGNAIRHGLVTDDVEWSLEGRAKRVVETKYTTCLECYAIIECYPCPECGFQPLEEDSEKEEPDVVAPGKLEKFNGIDRRAWYKAEVQRRSLLGHKLGAARHAFKAQFHVFPRKMRDIETACYVCPRHAPVLTEWGTRCPACLRA